MAGKNPPGRHNQETVRHREQQMREQISEGAEMRAKAGFAAEPEEKAKVHGSTPKRPE